MKKYCVIYHSTKKIECITILWWVLVLLFVHLTSRLASTFSCTLYHAFTHQQLLKFFSVQLETIKLFFPKKKYFEKICETWIVSMVSSFCIVYHCIIMLCPMHMILSHQTIKLVKLWWFDFNEAIWNLCKMYFESHMENVSKV
jgi:hypothetical protein